MSSFEPVGVSAREIEKTFNTRNGAVRALEEISFTVSPAEFMCIVGPSGCGKSTLLKILAGLIEPTAGHLKFSHNGVNRQPHTTLVFQEHGLFPWLTVLDNVAFGLEAQRIAKQERRRKAHRFLERVGLADFALNYPCELSVGMRQRAAIARAVLVNPQLLLMDEPFSALDAQSKLVLQEELLRLWKDQKQTVVYVTHDIEEAVLLGDRVLVMSGRPGRIREELRVPLDRPRNLQDREQADVREISWHIWKAIEGQVRRNLNIPS
jgi:NitT/TauT family transport system ATP-binding protein